MVICCRAARLRYYLFLYSVSNILHVFDSEFLQIVYQWHIWTILLPKNHQKYFLSKINERLNLFKSHPSILNHSSFILKHFKK